MSRIGRMPVALPAGVEVKVDAGNLVTVNGPKGSLTQKLSDRMTLTQEDGVILVTRPNDEKLNRSLHGLTRTLLNNMVTGVTEGYKKELDVNGVGYRVAKDGKKLVMNIGYSHQVIVEEPDGITIDVPAQNKIVVNGINKQQVGQFAAEIREKRPPEPYKGKGIKYSDEVIRRKEGKTGVKKK
ncbi:MAG: ribosomal protein [Firmicutes bacterium]|nr:ribosomal protein [Bacillota bacterium]